MIPQAAASVRVAPDLRSTLSRMPNSGRFALRFLWTVNPSNPFEHPRGLRRIFEAEEEEVAAELVDRVLPALAEVEGIGAVARYQDQIAAVKTDVFVFVAVSSTLAAARATLATTMCATHPGCTTHAVTTTVRGEDWSGIEVRRPGKPPVSAFVTVEGRALWVFRNLPSEGCVARELLEQGLGEHKLFAYAELRRAVEALPARFTAEGEELASVSLVQVGSAYIKAKYGAEWAQLMRGHWAASFAFRDPRGAWSIDMFDFMNDDIALRAHHARYGSSCSRSTPATSTASCVGCGWTRSARRRCTRPRPAASICSRLRGSRNSTSSATDFCMRSTRTFSTTDRCR